MEEEKKFSTYHGLNINKEAIYKQILLYETQEKEKIYLDGLQKKIEHIQEEIKKEKIQRRKAESIGTILGATAAGVAAGRASGIGGAMAGAATGLGVGAKAGRFIEEAWDAITGQKTDLELDIEFKKLKQKSRNIRDE